MNVSRLHEEQCDECRTWKWTFHRGGRPFVCPACKDMLKGENKPHHTKAHKWENGRTVVVVDDPDEYGLKGAQFTAEDHANNMREGCYTVGTRLIVDGVREIIQVVDGYAKLVTEV